MSEKQLSRLRLVNVDEEKKVSTPTNITKKNRFLKSKFLKLTIEPPKKMAERAEVYDLESEYTILETLGQGAYATVKHWIDLKTSEHVAIKISRRDTSREMLRHEYEMLKVIDLDTIIKPRKFIENASAHESYLVMDYLEGKDLAKWVEEGDEFTEEDVKSIMLQLINAVVYLHSLGISHKDIKPENVIMDSQKRVKIIDLNTSKRFQLKDGESTEINKKFRSEFFTHVSSPLYAAPELKKDCMHSESIDIWGLGVVMFTLLFGSFEEYAMELRTHSSPEYVNSLNDTIPGAEDYSTETKELLFEMLSFDPEKRPTAKELLSYKAL